MLSKETGIWRALEMAQHWRGNIRRGEQVSGRGDRPILFFLELAEYLDFVFAIVVAPCLLFMVLTERGIAHTSQNWAWAQLISKMASCLCQELSFLQGTLAL